MLFRSIDDVVTTVEDTPTNITALANDLDAEQAGFAPVVVTGPSHGELQINADGTFDYTPDLNWSGIDSFSYQLSDGQVDSNIANVTITVTPVNDAPVVTDATVTTLEEQAQVINPQHYAMDIDSNVAIFTSQIISGPANGSLLMNVDGSYRYTPNADFNGEDSFTYRVNDGELDSNIATVTINVAPVNDAPTGANNTVTLLEETTYTFQLIDFGFSDSHDDVQGGTNVAGDTMSGATGNNFAAVTINSLPSVGNLTLSGVAVTAGQSISVTDILAANLVFAPMAQANGSHYASFTFQLQDDGGVLNGGIDTDPTARTLTIDVTPVNDAPTGADNTVTILEDTPYTFLVADFGFSDIHDGNTFTNVIIDGLPLADRKSVV